MIPSNASRISAWRGRSLGWAPTVELREGLAKTIAYFDHMLRNNIAV